MSATRYQCGRSSCRFGFNESFSDGTERALAFRKRGGHRPDTPMVSIYHCPCGGQVMDVHDSDAAPAPDSDDFLTGGEAYGALILCCDLSGSMNGRLGETGSSRYSAVVEAVTLLLRDFAGRTDTRTDRSSWYSEAGRSFQYHRLILSVIRFGEDHSVFKLSGAGFPGGVPWFTVQTLAASEKWPLQMAGPETGYFDLAAIRTTVREKLLPLDCVVRSGTNLAAVLNELRGLVAGLYSSNPQAHGLPVDFGSIGAIANAPGHEQLWAAIYTDGELTGTIMKTTDAVRTLIEEAPKLHRITAFFGPRSTEALERGGGILKTIASECYAKHSTAQRAYLDPEQALELRHVLHMATVVDSGICWSCLIRNR